MTERPAHFTPRDGEFLPNRFAHRHWGDDHLNGPAIVGLAAQTLETRYGSPEFMPARLTVDLFKAARGVPTTVATTLIRDGRCLDRGAGRFALGRRRHRGWERRHCSTPAVRSDPGW